MIQRSQTKKKRCSSSNFQISGDSVVQTRNNNHFLLAHWLPWFHLEHHTTNQKIPNETIQRWDHRPTVGYFGIRRLRATFRGVSWKGEASEFAGFLKQFRVVGYIYPTCLPTTNIIRPLKSLDDVLFWGLAYFLGRSASFKECTWWVYDNIHSMWIFHFASTV